MPKLTQQLPKYRRHRASKQAVVVLDGRTFYLGPHGTETSRKEYDRLVGIWQANGRRLPSSRDSLPDLTISELIVRYWQELVSTFYLKHGRPTKEQETIKQAFRPLQELYGDTPAGEFGPLRLKTVRAAMIRKGWCRSHINKQVSRVKRLLKWGVEEELVPPAVHHALQAVSGLRSGRSEARETQPVQPVQDEQVDALRPHVSPQVEAMIQLQRLTGMRPGEAVAMRGCDIDMTGAIWVYRPSSHKTEHHARERIIPLGPRCQKIIEKFLKPDRSVPLFSPADAETERRVLAHAERRTPLSCGNRPGTNCRPNPKRRPRDRYTVDSYRRAIERACQRAFPAPDDMTADQQKQWHKTHRWHPHQLRHSAGTQVRKLMGLEAAQVWLGHSRADVTQVYAERDLELAREIAAQLG
jgi:integrase